MENLFGEMKFSWKLDQTYGEFAGKKKQLFIHYIFFPQKIGRLV